MGNGEQIFKAELVCGHCGSERVVNLNLSKPVIMPRVELAMEITCPECTARSAYGFSLNKNEETGRRQFCQAS